MGANLNYSLTCQASIVIETFPITSHSRAPGSPPAVPCFHSAGWDIENKCPIDVCLTYGGTLAQATIKGLDMLGKPPAGSVHRPTSPHVERYYLHQHQRYEVFAIHNGWVWLCKCLSFARLREVRPMNILMFPDYRLAVAKLERATYIATTAAKYKASQRWPNLKSPSERWANSKSRFESAPLILRELVYDRASRWFASSQPITKTELCQVIQAELRKINQDRQAEIPLWVPSRRVMAFFVDECLCALNSLRAV